MSTDTQSNNKRLAKNTIFLYLRMALLMCIGLYMSRVVLQVLGVEDYGLYNVVGGVVSMFGFLSSTLSISTQRFLNFEMGKGDTSQLKRVFSCSLTLHLLLVVIVLLLCETAGLWFVLNKLVIPAGRETAALWVYQFSIIAIIVQIIQLPFTSTIIAHEKMSIYAYISIFEAISKLVLVYLLKLSTADKLIVYAGLILLVHLLVAILYNIYCQRNFEEARFRPIIDKEKSKEMLGFIGWNMFGGFATICNGQGVNIVLNMFFGTVVNAARGIAYQVNGILMQFVNNFQLAVKPQIVKYYSSGEEESMKNLVFNSAKYSAFLMMIVSIPFMVETETVLSIWLGEYPDWTPAFIRLVLFNTIISSMTNNLTFAAQASGYVREISLVSGFIMFAVLPISYIMLLMGLSPIVPFIVNIVLAFLDAFNELIWLKKYIKMSIGTFYKKVYLQVFPIFAVSLLLAIGIHIALGNMPQYLRMAIVVVFSVAATTTLIAVFGIDRKTLKNILYSIKRKIIHS